MKQFSFSKKGIIFVAVLIFTLGNVVGVSASASLKEISVYLDEGVQLIVNGSPFTARDSDGNKLDPINYNGNIYLPLRSVAEAVGMKVKWDDSVRTASLGTFQEDQQDEVYTARDKTFQISLSRNWIRNDRYIQQSNPLMTFGAVNNSTSVTSSLGILGDSKTPFGKDVEIQKYSKLIIDNMSSKLENFSVKSQLNLKINDYPAKQYEIYGTLKNINVAYLLTIIETNKKFYQIVVWTGSNDLGSEKDEFAKIATTFKELNN